MLGRMVMLAGALASAATAQAAGPSAGVSVRAGDVVRFDLSGMPTRVEGGGRAVCKGTRIGAAGPEEATCERRFSFEVPTGAARLVYLFQPAAGRGERRIELPLTRSSRPITFDVPGDGTLVPPPPLTLPPERADEAARAAAAAQCGACGGGGFALDSFEVTSQPAPRDGSFSVRVGITTRVPAPAK